jgi:peroxiredoxin
VSLIDVISVSARWTAIRLSNLLHGPALLSIWQTSCVPCLKELHEFSTQADRIRASGLTVVALPASDPESDAGRDRKAVKEMLDRLKFPFDSARTIKNTIEILDEFQAEELQKHQRTVVQTSFLIDADRQAMAVYKRAVDLDQVHADMRLFNMNQQERLEASLPTTGRWFHAPLVEQRH